MKIVPDFQHAGRTEITAGAAAAGTLIFDLLRKDLFLFEKLLFSE
jgi:hypothetical protein